MGSNPLAPAAAAASFPTAQGTQLSPETRPMISGIRAPPTVDSDFEFSVSTTNGLIDSFSSGSSYVSDNGGFDSDDFETASERPFVPDPDDETLGNTKFVPEFVVARPYETDPDEEITENMEMLPLEEGGIDNVVDIGILPHPKLTMPIAQLSMDSDDDIVSIDDMEDDGFLGAVRVPGVGILERINSAPKVKVLEVDDDDDEEQSELGVAFDEESNDDSVSSYVVDESLENSILAKSEEKDNSEFEPPLEVGNGDESDSEDVVTRVLISPEKGFEIEDSAKDSVLAKSEEKGHSEFDPVLEVRNGHGNDSISDDILEKGLEIEESGKYSVSAQSAVDESLGNTDKAKEVSVVASKDGVLSGSSETNEEFQALKTLDQQEIESNVRVLVERNGVDLGINAVINKDDIVEKDMTNHREGKKATDSDDEKDHSQFEPPLEVGNVDDSNSDDMVTRVLVSSEKGFCIEDSVSSAKSAVDENLENIEEAKEVCMVASKDDILSKSSETDEEFQVLKTMSQQETELNGRILEERNDEDNAIINIDDMANNWEENTEIDVEVDEIEAKELSENGVNVHVGNQNSENYGVDIIGGKGSDVEISEGITEVNPDLSRGEDIQNLDSATNSEEKINITKDELQSESDTLEPVLRNSVLDPAVEVENDEETDLDSEESEEEKEISLVDESRQGLVHTSVMDEENSHDLFGSCRQIDADSDKDVGSDEEHEVKDIFDSAALAAILRAATGTGPDGSGIASSSPLESRVFSLERAAGISSSFQSLRSSSQPSPNFFAPAENAMDNESEDNLSEEDKRKLEKLQQIRVRYLRLIRRLGLSPEDPIAKQVFYRLFLAAGRPSARAFSLESAKRTAVELEAEGKNDFDFSLNILLIGKTGVGKSATINSILGERKVAIDAFQPGTTAVNKVAGTIDGVNVRVFDTPGLRSSFMEQSYNRKILSSIKNVIKKFPPDIVLYVDRVDTQSRGLNDLNLLRAITSSLGSSIWRNAIVTLTHAASTLPDGPSGIPLGYEVFVAQRSRLFQQLISQAVGDLRMMDPSLMNPVSLVENHPSCEKNRDGESLLPNGDSWRSKLLLLCYSMKIMSEVNAVVKTREPLDHHKLFLRSRSPPLPYLLSSLLQSNVHPKLSADQGGEDIDSDVELDLSNSDQENEDDEYEYDQLPPFRPLRQSQIAKLSKEQRKAYFEEYDYRFKLLQKKQWIEEVKRAREMKRKGKEGGNGHNHFVEDGDNDENESPSAVAVPLPDMVLPPSFDGDHPAYRYRFLEPTSQLLTRPVLDTHGWDHDCGYDGVSLEQNLAIASQFPAVVAVQMTKDKKEFSIQLDSSVSTKHGENGSTMAGFDVQTIGKQLAYIFKGETKVKNLKVNKTAAGISVTFLGENVATGFKVEDRIAIGKRVVLRGSAGRVRSQGNVACGANLEVRVRERDFPMGQDQTTLGLSLVRWRGELVWGSNFQSQISVGRSCKVAIRAGLNNKQSGQISVKTSSCEQLQIAILGILPIAKFICRYLFPQSSEQDLEY